MLRLLGILVSVLVAIGAALLTWPGFFRIEQMYPIAQIIPFRAGIALAAGVLAALCLMLALARPMRGFALSLVLIFAATAVANGAILLSRGTGGELPAATDSSVRVMTWNTAGEATSPAQIAQTAVAMGADIVSLPETTIETGEQVAIQMRELGSPMWAHHVEFDQGAYTWDSRSTTLLISPDLGDYAVIDSSADRSSNTSVVPSAVAMPVDGQGPIVVAVHAVAPRQSDMQRWRDDLRWLADQCAEANVIMAGDFNATVDHMSRLGEDGATLGRCHDAAADAGSGAVGTWPATLPRLLEAPIDHVMYGQDWRVSGAVVLPQGDSDSDHRPLVVQLEHTADR